MEWTGRVGEKEPATPAPTPRCSARRRSAVIGVARPRDEVVSTAHRATCTRQKVLHRSHPCRHPHRAAY
jgi:hypothetical protein